MCRAEPPAGGSGNAEGCLPHEPPAPSSAFSYLHILLQPGWKTRKTIEKERPQRISLQTEKIDEK